MLYLLPVLLFSISFGDNECNSVVYSNSLGVKYGYPTNQCQIIGNSFKFICDGNQINKYDYDSNDCTGNPSITENICGSSNTDYNDCTVICDKNDCDGITWTQYSADGCNDNNILTKRNYLPSICSGGFVLTCSGSQIQQNTCPTSTISQKYNSGCNSVGGITSNKFEGCDSCTTFNLFGAFIIIFITSLF